MSIPIRPFFTLHFQAVVQLINILSSTGSSPAVLRISITRQYQPRHSEIHDGCVSFAFYKLNIASRFRRRDTQGKINLLHVCQIRILSICIEKMEVSLFVNSFSSSIHQSPRHHHLYVSRTTNEHGETNLSPQNGNIIDLSCALQRKIKFESKNLSLYIYIVERTVRYFKCNNSLIIHS